MRYFTLQNGVLDYFEDSTTNTADKKKVGNLFLDG